MTTKKRSELSARGWRARKKDKHIVNSEIDFSDIPESTDDELKNAKRVGRPTSEYTKQLIAIRIDPRILDKIQKMAKAQDKPYQTFIHELLEKVANKKKAA